MRLNTFILNAFIIILQWSFSFGYNVVCYYPNWALYRPNRMNIADINAGLCTHVVYAFAGLNVSTFNVISTDPEADLDKNGYADFTQLKSIYPYLKTMISVGGFGEGNDGSAKFPTLAGKTENMNTFAKSVVEFLNKHNFDGLDFSWQYPLQAHRSNYIKLLVILKKALEPHGFLLSVTLPYSTSRIEKGFDLKAMSNLADFIIVEGNDMRSDINIADHHAPLYKRPNEMTNNTVDFVINYLISNGYPASKIHFIIPFYGRSWTLSSNKITPPAPASSVGAAGPITRGNGTLGYIEICNYVKTSGWTVYRDESGKIGPYAVSPDNKTWVGYDDAAMATIKVNYALSKGLGGVAVWEMTMDDARNDCGDGNYPLLKAINRALSAARLKTLSINKGRCSLNSGTQASSASVQISLILSFMCFILLL